MTTSTTTEGTRMTATAVDGVEVIANEPTEAPIKGRDGSPVFWQQVRTLLLANGETVYGCAHCDYTSPNQNSIRPHLHKHNRGKKRRGSLAAAEMSLGELVTKVAEMESISEDRDKWRRRALDAEKRLKTLRSALGGA